MLQACIQQNALVHSINLDPGQPMIALKEQPILFNKPSSAMAAASRLTYIRLHALHSFQDSKSPFALSRYRA